MDDVEYILRIILRARDEMAAVLQKARVQLRGFAKDSDTMNVAVTNLNQAMKNFDTNMDNISKKLNAWRAVIRDANGDGKALKKTFDDIGKSADKASKAQKDLNLTQEQLQKRARAVRDEMRGIHKAHEDGVISTKHAIAEYNRLGKELEKVALKMSEASRRKSPAHIWADEAETATERLRENDRRRVAQVKRHNDEIGRLLLEQIAAEEKAGNDRVKMLDDIEKRRVAMVRRHNAEVARLLEQQITEEARADKERAAAVDRRKQFLDDEIRYQREAAEVVKRIERDRLTPRRKVDPEDIVDLRRLAEGYRRLSRDQSASREETRRHGAEADRLNDILRRNTRDSDRQGGALKRLAGGFLGAKGSAAGFDNQMRGLGILAAVVSIQQLIGAVIGLGGELVSLAGSAVMAGGALGGILAAGAAQALPVVGLLAGAFSRVTGVMEAFQQQQKLQQAQFTDAEKGGQKAIDQANTLANAHDAVAEANDRLAESRKALTTAQKDGTEQLEDLIYAEKAAALAARGASLNVKEAQKALADAIASGASALEIQGRQQAVDEAKLGAGRAGTMAKRATGERRAAGGDISNLESVQSAAKAVEDSEKAVTKANRALDQTLDKADRAASSTMTAAANLEYLLSKMSPAERRMLTAVTSFMESYKRILVGDKDTDGIYGVIIDSFTRAVEKAEKIIEMPKVIAGIQGLANEIGANIDKIVNAIDPETIDQLLTIMDQAGDNMGPLVDMAIALGKAFLDIAETANPAFEKLIDYVGKVLGKFTDLTGDSDKMENFFNRGEEHLESWLNLIGAIIGLFAALTGASAEEGKTSIDDLTEKIKGWTDWIESHREEVTGFFEDARKAAYAVGGVLENLAETLFRTFNRERIERFADFLNNVVIPAIEDVIDTVGLLSDKFTDLMENEAFAGFAKFVLSMFLLSKIAGPIAGMLRPVFMVLGGIAKYAWWIVKHFDKIRMYASILRPLLMAAFTGPVAIIAAIVGAIFLLLAYFGKLDDIWNAIKETASEFMKDLQPAIEELKKAFAGLGINMGHLQVVFSALKKVGAALAEFISVYLIETIKGLGKILAGVALIIIRWVTFVVRIIKGVVDVIGGIIDIFQGEGSDKLKDALRDIGDAIKDFALGIVEAIGKILEGVVKAFLAPFKAAWAAIKDFFGISSPSKKFKELGRSFLDGLKDGLKGLANFLTKPWRMAWEKLNEWFDGKPKRLAESIIDELTDRIKVLWRRLKAAASYVWDKFKDGWDGAKKFGSTIVNAIVDGVKALPGALLNAVKSIGSKLMEVGSAIGNAIWDGIKAVFGGVGDIAKGMIGKISSFFGGGDDEDEKKKPAQAKPQVAAKADIGQAAIPFGAKDLATAQKMYEAFWKDMRRTADSSTGFIQRQFREMRIASSNSMEAMYKAVRGSIGDIQKSFDVRGDAIVKGWAKDAYGLMKVSHDALTYIGHETNQALKAMGERHINFGLTTPKKNDGKAAGGWINNQGHRGKDRGFYPLGDGEAVLPWQHQPYVNAALSEKYGFGLDGLFNHVKGYHAGGPGQAGFAAGTPGGDLFDGKPSNVNSAVKALIRLMKEHFPRLVVTSTTNHGKFTTTGNVSDHGGGNAVDMAASYDAAGIAYMKKAANWVLSSGLYKRLKQGIFNPILAVNRGERQDPPGQFAGRTWAEHANHLHLAIVGALTGRYAGGGGGGAMEEIKRQIVTPRATATARFVQSSIDAIRKLANQKIEGVSSESTGTEAGPSVRATGASAAQKVFNFFTGHGLSEAIAAGFAGTFQKESNFSTSVTNARGSGATGLAQWLGARLTKLKQKKNWQSLQTQLDYVWEELHGSESAAFSAIKTAKSPAEAARLIDGKYERSDAILSAPAYAEAWYKRFAKGKAMGGPIDGPDGSPVPILAHAGEWVLNKGQQLRAAMLAGLTPGGLKAMLGFGGGPTSFAKGGEVLLVGDSLAKGIEAAIKRAFKGAVTSTEVGISSAAAVERLKDNYKKAYKAVIFDAGTNDQQAGQFAKSLRRAHKLISEDQELIVSMFKGGPAASAKNKLLREFAKGKENVQVVDTRGIPLGADKLHPTAAGYRERAGLVAEAVKARGTRAAAGVDAAVLPPITTIKTLMDDVADTWKGITEAGRLIGAMKRDKVKKGDAARVSKAYQTTIEMLSRIAGDEGIGAMVTEIANRTSRAATRLKQDTFRIGAGGKVEKLLGPGSILSRELGSLSRLTDDLMGEKSVINQAMKRTNALIKKVKNDDTIDEKQRQANLELLAGTRNSLIADRNRVDSEIADVTEQRYQKQLEAEQLLLEEVTKQYDRAAKGLDLAKRLAAAVGNTDLIGSINQRITDNLSANINSLQQVLVHTTDPKAREEILAQIDDLYVQVQEAVQQAIREAGDAVSTAASQQRTKLDLFGRMADALGIVGQAGAAVIPGMGALSRGQIATGRIQADRDEQAGLFGVRDRAVAAGNFGYAKELTDKINELTVSIQEQTRAEREARFASSREAFDYNTSINGLETQLIEATDAATQQTSSAKLLELAQNRLALYQARTIEIQAQLDEAIREGDVKATQDLTKELLENKIAVQQNTRAVQDITGAGSAPASYTSQAWQWFRQAMLTGTGGVLPQYTPPVMADVSTIGPAGTSGNGNGNTYISTTVEVNEAGQPIDPNAIASKVVFAQATAQ